MRQIKFRGKDKDSNWVHGDLVHGVSFRRGRYYILPMAQNLAYVPNCDPINGVEVNKESICQFTGLHDKNGKEIYEGDIIKCNYKHNELGENYGVIPDQDCFVKGEVLWSNDCLGYVLRVIESENEHVIDKNCEYMLCDFDFEEGTEVIGNIYDNKELIKE